METGNFHSRGLNLMILPQKSTFIGFGAKRFPVTFW